MKKLLLIGFIILMTVTSLFAPPASQTASVNLAWDYDFSTNYVSGFKLYVGGNSGNYTNSVTVGTVTNGSILNLQRGATYYFTATAIGTNNLESDYSNEIIYTVPKKPGNPKNLALQP